MAPDCWGVLDIENVGDPWTGTLLCIGWKGEAYPEPIPQHVLDDLADPSITKVEFTKHDARWLRLAGYEVAGPIHDVQVLAWLLDEAQALDLESCAARYCGRIMDKRISEVGGRLMFRCDDGTKVPLIDAPQQQLLDYNVRDLVATEELYAELWVLLEREGFLEHFLASSVPFTSVLAGMETAGIPVDLEGAAALRQELQREISTFDRELHLEANLPSCFNLGSTQQLGGFLYEREFAVKDRIEVPQHIREAPKADRPDLMQAIAPARFRVTKVGTKYAHGEYHLSGQGREPAAYTDAGTPSTAAPKLRVAYGDDPWIGKLLELKQRETIVGTFLGAIERMAHEGRLYGRFKQTGTVTGRLSSSEPNLQNIPTRTALGRRVRELFRAEEGCCFVHADYSQLEPRLMAHFSQDPVMLRTFRGGDDIYLITARGIFGGDPGKDSRERSVCKTYVLGMGYGAGAETMAEMLAENGFPTRVSEVEGQLRELRRLYRVYFAWREQAIKRAEDVGYISTLSGRRRRVVEPRRGGHYREAELSPTQIANAKIQGSAADIVEAVMIRSGEQFPDLRLLVQVHDELMWEARRRVPTFVLHKLQRLAEAGHGYHLSVPLVFVPKVVRTWAEGK